MYAVYSITYNQHHHHHHHHHHYVYLLKWQLYRLFAVNCVDNYFAES